MFLDSRNNNFGAKLNKHDNPFRISSNTVLRIVLQFLISTYRSFKHSNCDLGKRHDVVVSPNSLIDKSERHFNALQLIKFCCSFVLTDVGTKFWQVQHYKQSSLSLQIQYIPRFSLQKAVIIFWSNTSLLSISICKAMIATTILLKA